MEVVSSLLHGFSILFQPEYLLFCLLGVCLGQLVGALPGIGPSAGIAILLPLTFGADPIASIVMFAGIYYGAQYGGTITSVLVSIPGESSSVMTSIDGYQLAMKGRAGAALGMAAIASFIAGTLGTIGLMLVAPALAQMALAFGPPEYFALVLLGLLSLALVGGDLVKGMMAGVAGLMLATIGVDPQVGSTRYMFGQVWLLDGVEFLVLAVALFGVGEVLASVERDPSASRVDAKIDKVLPTRADWVISKWATLRGSAIGFLIGVLPGAGATIATFIAYAVEKKVSRHPEKFGTGVMEAVAGPEAANNSASSGAMVPMLALGVPGSNTTAVLLGALVMFGLQPGPQLFERAPDLVWTIIASMFLGNLILLLLNLPLAGMFAHLLRVPYAVLYPIILALCIAGVFAAQNSMDDLWMMAAFGVAGYVLKKTEFPVAPLILGLVLGPLLENSLRQSMQLSHGSAWIFFERPVSLALLTVIAIALLLPLCGRAVRLARRAA